MYELPLYNYAHFRYLKGRITYDQMNKFIDGINAAYLSKYKLLRQKKSSLNDANRKRYENYKSLETKDTAGTVRVKKKQQISRFWLLQVNKRVYKFYHHLTRTWR